MVGGMSLPAIILVLFYLLLLHYSPSCHGQFLTPQNINIAEGKPVHATHTCGIGEGIVDREMYCKLVGSMWTETAFTPADLVHGQACDYCDPRNPETIHPPEYAVDGTSKWWQSPPLSRGLKYKEVNLTIDLGQEFHVAYVYITMANSPRPGVWVLERSTDRNKTYKPWQYFADSVEDCVKYFGEESIAPLTRDDQVICETRFSKLLPLENGEIVIQLLKNRPNADNFTSSQALQEFTKATNVRLRLMRPKLLGPLEAAGMDPSVTRRYFYSIKDIAIGGRCVCNGHALSCDYTKSKCQCQHNTCGDQCEKCCPGYLQKKWKPATVTNPNECEKCNCNDHSTECYYDEEVDRKGLSIDIHGNRSGGGVCISCKHNTEGNNCERCKFGFFRPADKKPTDYKACSKCRCSDPKHSGGCLDITGSCLCKANFTNAPLCDQCSYGYYNFGENCPRCPCYRNGTQAEECEPKGAGGVCQCKSEFAGFDCSRCAEKYWGFPNCKDCQCSSTGSVSPICNQTDGQCPCKQQYAGQKCDKCAIGFYDHPNCKPCMCDPKGTSEDICDAMSGVCKCKEGFAGERCDKCKPGYFGFPNCRPCGCDEKGSQNNICNEKGKCPCKPKFGGSKCSACASGFYKFPDCEPCGCDPAGSYGQGCDDGVCRCRDHFDGVKCNRCKKNFYNFPFCESCTCNPAGVVENFGCQEGLQNKLCDCKAKVTGRYCDRCVSQYKFLKASNPEGCEPCNCNRKGTINNMDECDGESGQCLCKQQVTALGCEECKQGTYALSAGNYFGCQDCACNVGGSYSFNCDRQGSCMCRQRIEGRRCDRPTKAHYLPTLYQYQYEIEDGIGFPFARVRYEYDEKVFPGFSWKGYAKFSEAQKEVTLYISIERNSFYQVIIAYHNPSNEMVKGNLTFINGPDADSQTISIQFAPTTSPKRYLVPLGKNPPFLMRLSEQTKVSLTIDKALLVDYMVLLPQHYFEATALKERVVDACTIYTKPHQLCHQYGFTQLPESSIKLRTSKDAAFVQPESFYKLDSLGVGDDKSKSFSLNQMTKGKYIAVLHYIYQRPDWESSVNKSLAEVMIEIQTSSGLVSVPVKLAECPYIFECRHVLIDEKGAPVEFDMDSGSAQITYRLTNGNIGNASLAVVDFAFVPKKEWHVDHVQPSLICVMRNFSCLNSSYNDVEGLKLAFGDQGEVNASTIPDYKIGSNGNGNGNGNGQADKNDESRSGWLDIRTPTRSIEMKGEVSRPGYYHFIVHYYQPNHPSFEVEAQLQPRSGLPVEVGYFSIEHCPNKAGCRARLEFRKPSTLLGETQDFILTLTPAINRTVKLDYLLVIHDTDYELQPMEFQFHDRSSEFLETCAKDAYYVDANSSEFCKESAFAISAFYNNGALFCKCNSTGSLGYLCSPLGGQCECKPNVIGRRCDACKSGYWGFPDCKPCNCSENAAYCDPISGDCICPLNVRGANCEECAPNTFGYDRYFGCEECQCHSAGVKDGNLQCNLTNGLCDCKETYDGRRCDICKAGFYDFPSCLQCQCDRRGTTKEICSRKTGTCSCKANANGASCDFCAPGTYNLEEGNPLGCTQCYCFGTTDICTESKSWYYPMMMGSDGYLPWKGAVLGTAPDGLKRLDEASITDATDSLVSIATKPLNRDPNKASDSLIEYFFIAPEKFLGKQINSYGGFIRYALISQSNGDAESGSASVPDLILQGKGINLTYFSDRQPASPDEAYLMEIEILEKNFRNLADGSQVTKPQLMIALVKLEGIFIRAAYFNNLQQVTLTNFSMDSTSQIEVANGKLASRVEQCTCGTNYKGSSCEECASGFYRTSNGPGLGFCVPCQCNGHSNECDPVTGKCFNCQHHTEGDHCERCIGGYHGNATSGSPYDCLICPCPLSVDSNNFALSCEMRTDPNEGLTALKCNCKPGYMGPRCEFCAAGYHGNPMVEGKFCEPCDCNNNIDRDDPASCDSISGRCIQCLNNTAGEACELCANGYYGDAVEQKDCKPCICDPVGTLECNRSTGDCTCKPNVIGDDCGECKANHWGFPEGNGCRPCNCGEASVNASCDVATGQCHCMPGVIGRTCDRCAPGFWNYTIHGCQQCGCIQKFSRGTVCNPQTGQCACLPGVIGEKCDQCPDRWAFVDQEGCIECGECQHALMDDTESMSGNISSILVELQSSSSLVYAKKRFDKSSADLDVLVKTMNDRKKNPVKMDDDFANRIETIENQTLEANQKSLRQLSFINDSLSTLPQVLRDSVKSEADLQNFFNQLAEVIFSINAASPSKVDREAHLSEMKRFETEMLQSLASIRALSFTESLAKVTDDHTLSLKSLEAVEDFVSAFTEELANITTAKERLNHFREILKDAGKSQRFSIENSVAVRRDLTRLNESSQAVQKMLDVMGKDITSHKDNLGTSKKAILESQELFKNLEEKIESVEAEQGRIREKREALDKSLTGYEILQDPGFNQTIEKAVQHANELIESEKKLKRFLKDRFGKKLSAINSYSIIDSKIENADNLAREVTKIELVSPDIKAKAESLKKEIEKFLNETRKFSENMSNDFSKPGTRLNNTLKALKAQINMFTRQLTDYDNILIDLERKESFVKEVLQDAKSKSNLDKEILDRLVPLTSEEALNSMLKESEIIRSNVTQAQLAISQADALLKQIPITLSESMSNTSRKVDILNNLRQEVSEKRKKVNLTLDKAREFVNRIEGSMALEPYSVLELAKPRDLERSGSYTKFSMLFRTYQLDGILAFIGNPSAFSNRIFTEARRDPNSRSNDFNAHRSKGPKSSVDENDFMAILLSHGRIQVVINLGDNLEQSSSEFAVNDNSWHRVTVERIGPTFKVTTARYNDISKQYDNITTSHRSIGGYKTVLNLNQDSAIFIGSLPETPSENKLTYTGQIADVMLGDTTLGLWNFKQAMYVLPAPLPPEEVKSSELQFNGRAYAFSKLEDKEYEKNTIITFEFKSYAPEGLLFLLAGDIDFLAIEVFSQKLKATIDLGSGYIEILSNETVNDGKWHSVELSRYGKEVNIKIDGKLAGDATLAGSQTNLETNGELYLGGYRSKHSYDAVTNVKYEGCLRELALGGRPLKFDALEMTPGASFGCLSTEVREAVFTRPGFIRMPLKIEFSESDSISLKFRTKLPNGLLFYASNANHSSYFAVYLRDGQLSITTKPGATLSTTKYTYNDDQWHNIMATKQRDHMRLGIDDKIEFEQGLGGNVSLDIPAGTFFFGGVPNEHKISLRKNSLPTQFIGCIGDAVVHDKFISFNTESLNENASLKMCSDSDLSSHYEEYSKEDRDLPIISGTTVTPSSVDDVKSTQTPEETDDYCKLPLNPPQLKESDFTDGEFYGKLPTSRREYYLPASVASEMISSSTFKLQFRAIGEQGVLLFITDETVTDYVSISMRAAKLMATWNMGTGMGAIVIEDRRFNDSQWHEVTLSISGKSATFVVDNIDSRSGFSTGQASSLNIKSPLYIGGIPETLPRKVEKATNGTIRSFIGCIKNVELNSKRMDFSNSNGYHIERCVEKVEPGIFLNGNGYLACGDKLKVGRNIKLGMEIKLRRRNALLMATYAKNATDGKLSDYLIVASHDDQIFAVVNNGNGPIVVNYTTKSDNYICDKRWHQLLLVKIAHTLFLEVDGQGTPAANGVGGISVADTDTPLYIGSIPEEDRPLFKGLLRVYNLHGCVRNFSFSRLQTEWNKYSWDLSTCKSFGEVRHGCLTV